jgi:thioredoxin-dependent peroxiredoxin
LIESISLPQFTDGEILFHDWIGDSWAVLFSHPNDFTPVCATKLGYLARSKPEFDRRSVKVIGLCIRDESTRPGNKDVR